MRDIFKKAREENFSVVAALAAIRLVNEVKNGGDTAKIYFVAGTNFQAFMLAVWAAPELFNK